MSRAARAKQNGHRTAPMPVAVETPDPKQVVLGQLLSRRIAIHAQRELLAQFKAAIEKDMETLAVALANVEAELKGAE